MTVLVLPGPNRPAGPPTRPALAMAEGSGTFQFTVR